jgi:hypothetical protein
MMIAAIALLVYSALVFYIGFKRPPSMIRLVKLKVNKNMSDDAAALTCKIFASLALIASIVFFILAK